MWNCYGAQVVCLFLLFFPLTPASAEEAGTLNVADLILQSESTEADIQEAFSGLSAKEKKGICHHFKLQQQGKGEQDLKYEQDMVAAALKQVEAMAQGLPDAQRQQLIADIKSKIATSTPMINSLVRQVQRGLTESMIDCSEVEGVVVQAKSAEMAGVEVIAIDD